MRLSTSMLLTTLFVVASARAGDLKTIALQSQALGKEVQINVILPDGYESESARRYPVVYLLHGFGGNYSEWQRVGVVDESKGVPAIIVMPEGDQSFYVNGRQAAPSRWEDYIVNEVVKHIDAQYRTDARREARAVSGLSMGGYGAMMLGLRHPDMFASIASHSGALGVPSFTVAGEIGDRLTAIFGPDGSDERQKYDLKRLARELRVEDRPDIYIDCGSSDFLLDSNRKFVEELQKQKYAYEYREVPGGHDFAYWKRNVRYSLDHQLRALAAAKENAGKVAAAKKAEAAVGTVAGEWDMVMEIQDQKLDYVLRFAEKEGKLSGVLVSPRSGEYPAKNLSFKDGVLKFEVDRNFEGQAVTLAYEGKLTANGLSGNISSPTVAELQATWTAKKKKKPEEL